MKARLRELCSHARRVPRRGLPVLALAWGSVLGFPAVAQTVPTGFAVERVASGLNIPTAMAFAPDGRLFISEQKGALRIVKAGALLAKPFLSMTVDSGGERGLLGIAFDPGFATNGYLYLYHTIPGKPAHNAITRFTAKGDSVVAGSNVKILDLDSLAGAMNHNGGAIHFGADGKLFVAVGNNVQDGVNQSLTSRLGKMLRINSNGTIPSDNPRSFPEISGTTQGANRAIWAVGLRNPFTFAINPHGGDIVINDVGGGKWEEINPGKAGANYGWSISEGPTTLPGITGPLFAYPHSGAQPAGCAVAGGTFYNEDVKTFPGKYFGKYFFSDYCKGWIYYLDPKATAGTAKATSFLTGANDIVDLKAGPDGDLYYLEHSGDVRRVRYTGTTTQQLLLSGTDLEVGENGSARVGVRLAAAPAGDVLVTTTHPLSDKLITVSPTSLTFHRSNWNVAQFLTVAVQDDADTVDEGARFNLTTSGLPTATFWVTGVDDDRAEGAPRAVITRPRPGDTVSGKNAEFFGDGRDDVGTLRAKFRIDNVLVYTDVNNENHFHINGDHNRWDTTKLANGPHYLEMRVFDRDGHVGRHMIRVRVSN